MSSDTRWLLGGAGLVGASEAEAVEGFGVFCCDKLPFWDAFDAEKEKNHVTKL